MVRMGEEIREAQYRRLARQTLEEMQPYGDTPMMLVGVALGRISAIVEADDLSPVQQVDRIRAIVEAVRSMAPALAEGA